MEDQTLINGILAKREDLQRDNPELRERMVILCKDIEALDRVLDPCAYKERAGRQYASIGSYRLILPERAREYFLAELRKADEPFTSGQRAYLVCQWDGRNPKDRWLFTDVTPRVRCAMRKMRGARVVECEWTEAGQV